MPRLAATLMTVAIVSFAAAQDQAPGPPAQPATDHVVDRTWTPQPGDQAVIFTSQPQARVAALKDPFAYLDWTKFSQADDRDGLTGLAKQGRLFTLENHTPIRVIQRQDNPYLTGNYPAIELRILDGPHKGDSAWVHEAWVNRLLERPTRKAAATDRTASSKAKVEARPINRAALQLGMAQALEKNGSTAPALDYYRRLVRDFPDSPEAGTASDRIKALTREIEKAANP